MRKKPGTGVLVGDATGNDAEFLAARYDLVQGKIIDIFCQPDQAFFDALFDLIVRTADELGETLQQE